LVSDVSTLRRHLEHKHKGAYNSWASKAGFESKLPSATKARREAAKPSTQTSLDSHLEKGERIIPYSHDLFKEAALEWLITTDQPLQAFKYSSFQNMIDIASRAPNGVRIPSGADTRTSILNSFKKNVTDLRRRLNVS
ncbi:hypothetical protein BKA70DRAFT_1094076, partial [Coprinopsis sp. MPI-PUGE-AT-0042]